MSGELPVVGSTCNAYIDDVAAEREIASPPQAPALVPPQAMACGGSAIIEPKFRAALYVDGLNLYHAIDKLGRPHLKWLNIWELAESLIPKISQQLVKAVYCTARKHKDDPVKLQRQREFVTAIEYYGVKAIWGHFIYGELDCRGCNRTWPDAKEKESDVNLALALIDDAYRDVFDHAYLVTADSDQGSTARMLKLRFPNKRLTSITPPGQERCKAIMAHTDSHIALTAEHLERSLLPASKVDLVDGKQTLRFKRPEPYKP